MGNSHPRLKLHYVQEQQDRTITGLIQILDVEKGTAINEVDVYVVGREKISYVSVQNFLTLKEDYTFFKEKVTIPVTDDAEPTFSIRIPDDLPNSGHGGNYGKGLGYAIGYHVYVEAKGNCNISDLVPFTVALRGSTSKVVPFNGFDKGQVKLGGRTLEYEIPKGMPRGTNQTLKFRLSAGENQRVRIRVRELGRQLKGQEQTSYEIKYQLDDEAIIAAAAASSDEWCTIDILISKYSLPEFQGKVLQVSHHLEITAIGSEGADYCKIPISFS